MTAALALDAIRFRLGFRFGFRFGGRVELGLAEQLRVGKDLGILSFRKLRQGAHERDVHKGSQFLFAGLLQRGQPGSLGALGHVPTGIGERDVAGPPLDQFGP